MVAKKAFPLSFEDILVCGDWAKVGRTNYGEALIGGKRAKVLFIAMDRGGRGDPNNKVLENLKILNGNSEIVPTTPRIRTCVVGCLT